MNKFICIYKSVDKALDKLIEDNAKEYLKEHKKQSWYVVALEGYKKITRSMLELLKEQSKDYGKAIEGKKLFNKKIKKNDEDINDDINDDIKEVLENITKSFIENLEDFYDEEITTSSMLLAAKASAEELDLKFNFNKYNKVTKKYLESKKIEWAKQVAETTENRVKELLVKGFQEGLGSYDIAESIYEDAVFSYNRAEAIARTEIIGSCNYADYSMWQLDDDVYAKKWSSTGDGRTRLNHSLADGQIRKLNEPFDVGGEKLMYPLDGSLGAGAGNIVNCRCTMFYLTKEEYKKEKGI